jgi:hypothetical protein
VIYVKAEKIIGDVEFFGDELPHEDAVHGRPLFDYACYFFRYEFCFTSHGCIVAYGNSKFKVTQCLIENVTETKVCLILKM